MEKKCFLISLLLLLLAVTGDVLGLICYLGTSAVCSGRTTDIPGGLSPQNIRECCINRNGFALNLFSGDEDCIECIVIEWLNGTSFEGPERTESYQFAVDYTKGVNTLSAGSRRYDIEATRIGSTESSDFQLETSTSILVTQDTAATVRINLLRDNVALEPNETVRLRLNPRVPPPIGEILLDTIDITIRDTDNVTLQFTQPEYVGSEMNMSVQVAVTIGGQEVQTPLVAEVIPLNLSEVDGSISPPAFDPLRPNRAQSFPEELRDFNTTPITVTFQGEIMTVNVNVGIEDDNVHEPDEFFAVRLDAGNASSRVMLGQALSLCRIEDNDEVTVRLANTSYTVSESDGFVNLTVVREGLSSQTVSITLTTTNGSALAGEDYNGTTQTINIGPGGSSVAAMVQIIDDNLLEGVEQFTAQLSLPADQIGVMLGAAMTTVVITDNDKVTIGFENETYQSDEGQGSVEVCARVIDGGLQRDVEVTLVTQDGSAVVSEDYQQVSVVLTFGEGSERNCSQIELVNDTAFEGTENLTVVLSTSEDVVTLLPDTAQILIRDDDIVTVEFDPASYTVDESDRYANITIVKRGQTAIPVTVNFATADGSAIAGEDYTATSESVIFQISDTSQEVMVPILPDTILEESVEQFSASLSVPTGEEGVILGTNDMATVQITDDDVVTVEFDPTSYTVSESDHYANITVVKLGETTQTVSVNFTTADGSATAGQDYSTTSQTVTFAPTQTSQVVMVPIIDDNVFEGAEQFTARLSLPTGQSGVVLGANMATVEITDEEDTVTVEFDSTSYTVSESDRYANITIVKRGQTTFTVSVEFNTTDGSATAGEDYTATSMTVIFQAADTSQVVMVPILADNLADGVKQFTAQLSLPAGQIGVMLGAAMATVEITDDDSVTVEFDPTSYTVSESDRYANITVVKRGQTTQTVSVNFTTADGSATAGQDYSTTSQTVIFAPSEDSQTVMVPIIDDNVFEGVEQFTAQLSLPAGQSGVVLGTSMATVEITDDDLVTVEFDPTSYTVSESDRYANITIVKLGETTQTVSVEFRTADGSATAGEDYTTISTTVVFQAAETSRVVMVPILGDSIFEGVEQFTAQLLVPAGQSGVVLGANMATVEITDEEDTVTVEFDPTSYTVSESAHYANITVVKRGQTTQTVSVAFTTAAGSATAGQDYNTTSQTVTFAPTQTSQVVMVPIIDDSVFEGAEQFFARLSLPAGQSGVVLGADMATVEITDDDPLPTTPPPTTPPPTTPPPTTPPPTTPPPTTPATTSTPPSEVNDTVVGDPLMTVPLRFDATQVGMPVGTRLSLCYEVHGQPDQNFNFVSDGCVSVNAHYTRVHPGLDINVIDQIGVHAVDNSNQCHNIQADLSGCRALVDGVELTMPYRVAGISVRRFPNRIRIAVPNCEDQNLVMWVFCQDATFSVPGVTQRLQTQMIRFVISRGLSLNESSHGIVGQFWNVPITLESYMGPAFRNQDAYIITFTHPDAPGPRRFVGVRSRWTWEKRYELCLYVGNRQAGPLYEVENPNDPVIEGVYTDYRVTSLFGTEYRFSHFDSSRCTN